MGIDELEAAALKLEPKARARLAGRLLDSLENLFPEESARIWGTEGSASGRGPGLGLARFSHGGRGISGRPGADAGR